MKFWDFRIALGIRGGCPSVPRLCSVPLLCSLVFFAVRAGNLDGEPPPHLTHC